MKEIRQFLARETGGLRRLKELLPVFFDLHRVYALETQKEILAACGLAPVLERTGVTFRLDPAMEPPTIP